ncbi:MAG: YvcK family protein [Deltaproteobacteria bacterium]|nr:YvcK family protein [Deltaproteobacteria bacterium]
MLREGDHRPITQIALAHPTELPLYEKVARFRRHPTEGPAIALLSGGTATRVLSQTLIHYSHNTAHILPVFDDGGSSRVLRHHFGMPPPGDLRNRLMAISDMSRRGNPEVNRLFRTRLPVDASPVELEAELMSYLSDHHPQMANIEERYRRIISKHLERFATARPKDFDLRGGNIGNFVITGAYLAVGDLESVLFELSALAAARGAVYPVCRGANYHLRAEYADGSTVVGQSRITTGTHPPLRSLSIVEPDGDDWREATPELNPLAARAINKSALITYAMGSFYTSLVSSLLVGGVGEVIRQSKRPKILVANLRRDQETPTMTVSQMISELCRALRRSDSHPGTVNDYIQYVLVSDHGPRDNRGRVPVDLEAIRDLGVVPIVLPLENDEGDHNPHLVAAVLLSLC